MVQQITNNNEYNNYLAQKKAKQAEFGANLPEQSNDSFVSSSTQEKSPPKNKFALLFEGASIAVAGVSLALLSKSKAKVGDLSKTIDETSKKIGEVFTSIGEKLPENISTAAERLGIISTKDALSGMSNRRVFDAALNKHFTETVAKNGDMHMAMVDMDYFKSINEVLGHTTGDKFIQLLSKNIQSVGEKHGVSGYRWGGEEFAILMPDHSPEKAKAVVQEIADSIKSDKEIQGYQREFLIKAKRQLRTFERRQSNYQKVWDKVHEKDGNQAEIASEILKLLGEKPKAETKNEQVKLQSAMNELTQIVKSGNDQVRVDSVIQKYKPSIAFILNKKYHKKDEILQRTRWLEHVSGNGFTISAGIGGISGLAKDKPTALLELTNTTLENAKADGRNVVSMG